ncbi:MAG: Pvc16 family protein [Terriglobales bacterium]
MSNALAIATVTALLKDVLEQGFTRHNLAPPGLGIADITVSALPPDIVKDENGKNHVNLFLYQVTPNSGWRNVGLASRDSQGVRVSNPPLALDLHYLLTAYSRENFKDEILLGYAMYFLHEMPVFTRQAIRERQQKWRQGSDDVLKVLAGADVAGDAEQIKITPTAIGTEEMSKLWSAFQTHYRPTAAYQVSVVLIESQRPAKAPLPVRDRNVVVASSRRPVIEGVSPQMVLPQGTLTLRGRNLAGLTTKVRFGAAALADPQSAGDTRIDVRLPAGLPAGINTVQVIHLVDFGTGSPDEPHSGSESNLAAFMLVPRITTNLPGEPLQEVARRATLTLSNEPPPGRSQQAALVLGERAIPIPARPPSDPPTPTTDKLDFPIPADFPLGPHLVRVRVDGAESPLVQDTDENSPTFRQYIGPNVKVVP